MIQTILPSILRAEYFKSKRNIGVILILLFPVVFIFGYDIYIVYNTFDYKEAISFNPWIDLLGRNLFLFYSFFYPLMIAIYCYSLCYMEYSLNNFKILFTLPVSRGMIYFAKIINMIETLFLSILITYAMFLLSGFLLSYLFNQFSFQDYDVRLMLNIVFFKFFIGSLSILFVQFAISLLFKNFIIPIGIACFGTSFALIGSKWEYIDYLPYHSLFNATKDFLSEMTIYIGKVELINMIYIFIFIIISNRLFIKQTIK